MTKNILHKSAVALAVALGIAMTAQTVKATTIQDLTGGGAWTDSQGATFRTTVWQPTGTGVFDPFVRLDQKGNHTYEAGYNTSLGTPLDVLGNSWHKDLLLTDLKPQTVNGVDCFLFRLDLNQSAAASEITLNQVEIFQSAAPAPTTGVGMDKKTGRATNPSLLGERLAYDMNSDASPEARIANAVKLDFDLNKGGSGKGDMQLYVPTTLFDPSMKYIVFYSQFGLGPIELGTETNDGFEEWASYNFAPVPEPTTVIAGALLLIPFGFTTLRALRSRKV